MVVLSRGEIGRMTRRPPTIGLSASGRCVRSVERLGVRVSFLNAVPESVSGAAGDLLNLGSNIGAANAAAQVPTASVLAAGDDEVSAAVAQLFSGHAAAYQALAAQASNFHNQFVQLLSGGSAQYASAEASNAQATAADAIN